MQLIIHKAYEKDLEEVHNLLRINNLPIEGVKDHIQNFLIVKNENSVIACAGLEIYDNVSLLRSVSVHPEFQGKGIGKILINKIQETAEEKNISNLYLLTKTAEQFFNKFGFQVIERSTIHPFIKYSKELKGACPKIAICMKKEI